MYKVEYSHDDIVNSIVEYSNYLIYECNVKNYDVYEIQVRCYCDAFSNIFYKCTDIETIFNSVVSEARKNIFKLK